MGVRRRSRDRVVLSSTSNVRLRVPVCCIAIVLLVMLALSQGVIALVVRSLVPLLA